MDTGVSGISNCVDRRRCRPLREPAHTMANAAWRVSEMAPQQTGCHRRQPAWLDSTTYDQMRT